MVRYVDWNQMAKLRYKAWWHNIQDWLSKAIPSLDGQPRTRTMWLFLQESPDDPPTFMPLDRENIIPARHVWDTLKKKIDAFYDIYSEQLIDEHNWTILADQLRKRRSSERPLFKTGFVYFAQDPIEPSLIKIGYSVQPDIRMRQIVSPNGNRPELCFIIPTLDMVTLEGLLHMRFEDKRVIDKREWFRLLPEDIELIARLTGIE